jgi:hemoglobin/transferrin/lactoferrin receptor protein
MHLLFRRFSKATVVKGQYVNYRLLNFAAPILLLAVSAPVLAEDASVELDRIVVVTSKTPRVLSDVVGQVSVITAEDVSQHLAEGLDDLLRYEPGINTASSGTRFGVSGVNIRGIGGNRVAIEVDGVPLRDRFAIGNFSDGGRALVETDLVKRVEVLHGPASTLYGSDALGGVMAITTWDPDDLLAQGDKDRNFKLRGGYRGSDDSWVASGTAAWGGERSGALVSATLRDGHQLDNMATGGADEDTQNWSSQDYFFRLTRDTVGGNRFRLSVEDFQRDAQTEIRSVLGQGRFRRTTALAGDDTDQNQRLNLDFEFTNDHINQGVARIFHSNSETRNLSLEERAASFNPVRLERYFQYQQDASGLELNLFRELEWRASHHRLGAGIEFIRTETEEFRDGFQQSLVDDSITRTVLGEDLPVRDFPNSETDEFGVFFQDEIRIGDGRWEVIPALRYDRYDLSPKPDSIYMEDNPGTETVSVSEDRISPRLGILFHITGDWSFYGQYVEGFRAPPFEDANIGLDIPLFNIRAIPNPDLRSETSTGWEAGVRKATEATWFSLAVFDTDYDDFIDTKAFIGVDPESGVLLFQSRNIESARIRGVDLRLQQDLGNWGESFDGWALNAAAYWSEGDNRDNGQPLNSVSPPQAIVGLSWTSPDDRWDANLTGTFTQEQDQVDETAGVLFKPPGYGIVDLTAGWRHSASLELRAGVYNIGNKRYWRWSEVAGLAPTEPALELLTRPGRHWSISALFTF